MHASVGEPTGRAARVRSRRRLIGAVAAVVVVAPASAAFAAGGTTTGADLQVTGSASTGSPTVGSVYTYTFQVKNNGPDTATSAVLSNPLPTGTVYNYATDNGSTLPCAAFGDLAGGATVSCQLGAIAKGGQATVVISVTAPQVAVTYGDTATTTATSTDPNASNNAVTVTVQTKAAATGGGGGGGGVNKGGVNDPTAPTLVATPCATLANMSAPTGYYLTWAAIWNTFTLKSCSSVTETVNVEVTETNQATGAVDYDVIYPFSLLSAQNLSMVLDNDFAPFNTTYTVGFTATDPSSGAVLSTGSAVVTTLPPQ